MSFLFKICLQQNDSLFSLEETQLKQKVREVCKTLSSMKKVNDMEQISVNDCLISFQRKNRGLPQESNMQWVQNTERGLILHTVVKIRNSLLQNTGTKDLCRSQSYQRGKKRKKKKKVHLVLLTAKCSLQKMSSLNLL